MSLSKISRVQMRDANASAHGNSVTSNAVESPQSRKRRLALERQRRRRSKTKSDKTLNKLTAQKASLRARERMRRAR